MSIGGIDNQTFGAMVVSKTLDFMNGSNFSGTPGGMSQALPTDQATAEAQLVTQTIHNMNQNMNQNMASMNNDYSFQTQVLGAYTMGKGTLADSMV